MHWVLNMHPVHVILSASWTTVFYKCTGYNIGFFNCLGSFAYLTDFFLGNCDYSCIWEFKDYTQVPLSEGHNLGYGKLRHICIFHPYPAVKIQKFGFLQILLKIFVLSWNYDSNEYKHDGSRTSISSRLFNFVRQPGLGIAGPTINTVPLTEINSDCKG